jgi:hypothetical protein
MNGHSPLLLVFLVACFAVLGFAIWKMTQQT